MSTTVKQCHLPMSNVSLFFYHVSRFMSPLVYVEGQQKRPIVTYRSWIKRVVITHYYVLFMTVGPFEWTQDYTYQNWHSASISVRRGYTNWNPVCLYQSPWVFCFCPQMVFSVTIVLGSICFCENSTSYKVLEYLDRVFDQFSVRKKPSTSQTCGVQT